MAEFVGKVYKFDRSENSEAYMDFLGVQGDNRANYVNAKPDTKLVKNGDGTYTLDILTQDRTLSNTFHSGKEFDEQMIPGVVFKTTITVESNKIVQVQKHPNGKVVTVVREYTPTEMKSITTAEGWDGKAVRYYKAA